MIRWAGYITCMMDTRNFVRNGVKLNDCGCDPWAEKCEEDNEYSDYLTV